MERDAHKPDSTDATAELEMPAKLSPRQWLEWEVSQLADGTLAGDRRADVEAALVRDSALREAYAAHRRVHALLGEAQAPETDLGALRMDIMATIADEPAYGTSEPRREVTAAGGRLAELLGRWWLTVTAAAAALAVGLSAGIFFFGARGGELKVELAGNGGVPAISQLEVEGPVTILQQSQSIEEQVIALTFAGPDYRAILDPQNEAPLPSYTYSYGTSAVVDTPSRMIIASAGGDE